MISKKQEKKNLGKQAAFTSVKTLKKLPYPMLSVIWNQNSEIFVT